MKKYLFIAACIFQVLTSCKKATDIAASNTISATIDGVDESFSTSPSAQLSTGVTLNSNLGIYGTNGSATGADALSITLQTNKTIATGTYTSGSSSIGAVQILYSHGTFSLVSPNTYTTDPTGTATTVTISTLTNTNVQGTFSGKLFQGGSSKTVTNGKFNLTLK